MTIRTKMLDNFDLVDKRQFVRYDVDWDNHMVVTYRKNVEHIVLNVQKLRQLTDQEKAIFFSEVIQYIDD